MIGLVFVGTIYHLESGWRAYEYYEREMEALTVYATQLIIAYFSTVLFLALLQEPFLPGGVTTLAYVTLAGLVVLITRPVNAALRSLEQLSPSDREARTVRISRVSNWIAFVLVFVVPPVAMRALGASTGSVLSFSDTSIAWTALLALLFGYWNLVQFLLLPYEMRRQQRDVEHDSRRR